jgi:hypothetical protein
VVGIPLSALKYDALLRWQIVGDETIVDSRFDPRRLAERRETRGICLTFNLTRGHRVMLARDEGSPFATATMLSGTVIPQEKDRSPPSFSCTAPAREAVGHRATLAYEFARRESQAHLRQARRRPFNRRLANGGLRGSRWRRRSRCRSFAQS